MRKAEFYIEYTEKSVDILQKGFFGNELNKIEVPFLNQAQFGEQMKEFLKNRELKMLQSKLENYRNIPLLEMNIRFSDDRCINLMEGCSNAGDNDYDAFAIYDIQGEPMLANLSNKTVVIKFCDLPMLINSTQKYNFK